MNKTVKGSARDDGFPIADYESLRVSEILPLLDELYDDELRAVREREEQTKGRRAILDRLQAIEREESGGRVGAALARFFGERGPGLLTMLGTTLIVVGFIGIGVAWYHAGNTDQVWVQVQEVVSGGFGGLALVIVGTGLLVVDQLQRLSRSLDARTPPSSAPTENGS